MYIDLHCHTKNAKRSETKREVDSTTFLNAMSSHGVGIVAITNHNLFCKEQYDEFSQLDNNLMVWPGIELDVDGDKSGSASHGHVIIISNPKYVTNFNKVINDEIGDTKPDDDSIKNTILIKISEEYINDLNKELDSCIEEINKNVRES